MYKNRAFSLLELLIVIAIIAVIGVVGFGFYANYGKNISIKSISQNIVFDLKNVQSKSMTGADGLKWGIHFVNGATDYYEIFSTATDYNGASIISKNYLSGNVAFSNPVSSSVKDIIFQKIKGGVDVSSTGGAADTSISIIYSDITKTINIYSLGNILIQ